MLFMKRGLLFIIHCNFFLMGFSQTVLPLYAGAIPNSKPVKNEEKSEITSDTHVLVISHISKPELSIFLPPADKASGTAVVICPGGGYEVVAAGHEGNDVAKKLNEMGIAAFVLKYRIPSDESMVNKEIGPLQDAQRAIQLVRQNARKWHIDPTRVGIMGFSAGGHLAATAGTHFNQSMIENNDHINLRPDFMVLIYPVISFTDSIGHIGSRDHLLGKNPSAEKIVEYSNELQVSEKTPPAFLVHAGDDDVVKVQNALYFYEALQRKNIPAELHIYPKGGHGFGMNNSTTNDKWMNSLKNWFQSNGWLKRKL
jgi:acetyl esterase/lipase